VGNNPVNWVDPFGLATGQGWNSIEASIKSCVNSYPGNIARKVDCLKQLLEVVDDPKDLQKIYRAINKEHRQLVKFTKDMNSTSRTIAKKGKIDKAKKLVDRFGGKIEEWTKKACKDASGKEWHWYEHKSIGKVGVKPKGALDPWYLK
jgi:hypothetical protein